MSGAMDKKVTGRRGWLKWPAWPPTRRARTAEAKRPDAQEDFFLPYEPGMKVRVLLQPFLPEPFAGLLDFGALAREAEEGRQEATGRRQGQRRRKGLRAFLKPDVTRTEELILTAELSRTGSCLVAPPGRHGQDRRSSPRGILRLSVTDEGDICVTDA